MPEPLPIDPHLPEILGAVRAHGAVVVVAPPGSGKTTRVPPALLALGPTILLQPRRVAARSLARRIAHERGWTVGDEVGWQVRFEARFGPATRLLVATEGVLTARLQSDPLLSGFAVAVLDEFHERSIHADLGLALLRQARAARDDLRVVVMSATLDPAPVAAFLGGCPILEFPGRPYPVEMAYAPGRGAADAARDVLATPGGHVLVFLPGAPEIRRLETDLVRRALPDSNARVLPLHGSLDADDQDRALAPSPHRKVILATNLAETSLTVDGVTDVIDTGLHKVLRYVPGAGLDRLEIERISRDSAEQRAGRAGRTGPGRALRLWDARDQLRAWREPEIARIDLAAPFLDVLGWGADPSAFEWFEAPSREPAAAAMALLEALGAQRRGRITPLGRELQRFPLHPRLARILVEAGASRAAAAACAILADGWRPAGEPASTDSDLLSRADAVEQAPWAVRRAADALERLAGKLAPPVEPGASAEERLARAVLAGFPDRVARRREPGSPRLLLAGGTGAVLGRESGVRGGEWLVALDVEAAGRTTAAEARVRAASRIDRAWLLPTRRSIDHALEAESGVVRAVEREWYGALVLGERPVPPDASAAEGLLATALRARARTEDEIALLRRLRFAGIAWDEDAWIAAACRGKRSLAEVDLLAAAPRDLERLAPTSIPVPSGRRARLEYKEDGSVAAAVKLQELFGLAESPRVGPRREPVTFVLLAPSGRPVQTTRDLAGFWAKGYPEVRKELRGRYPRHPWPEDPWTAAPTHRAKPRGT